MIERRRGVVAGIVQGVGFRPFVVRLAQQCGLSGFVQNCSGAVLFEVEGATESVNHFANQLLPSAPPNSQITEIRWQPCSPQQSATFDIVESKLEGSTALATPVDLAPCTACLEELYDPDSRHYQYPFINCVDCGPRFSIIRSTPFDRANTSMNEFPLCSRCEEQFNHSIDRRFHLQGICCKECGPRLDFFESSHQSCTSEIDPLAAAAGVLGAGKILALKGVGGYQLIVAADNPQAIARLRQGKRRPTKPFAVMFRNLKSARQYLTLNDIEAQTLSGPAAPIVLLQRQGRALPESIAPANPTLGAMLPASPLHILLADRMTVPLVVTSGNLHGEPIITDDTKAREQLAGIADAFLIHNREIVHAVDDSVVQLVKGQVQLLRLARGFAPSSFAFRRAAQPNSESDSILATGGHLKQTPLLLANGQAVCWPQVGDLDSWPAQRAMVQSLDKLPKFLHQPADTLAIDLHPDYATSLWAEQDPRPAITVQHHHAHVAACLAEHGLPEALGVAWDGAGYGIDGSSWGGEFLQVDPTGYRRLANLRPFPLPGGEAAARNGWRVLAGLCAEAEPLPPRVFNHIKSYLQIARNDRVSPLSSSIGRLFDAVAALSGLCPEPSFEGQAAMAVQHAALGCNLSDVKPYPFGFTSDQLDWRPMLPEMFADSENSSRLASRFQATLVAMVVTVIETHRPETVALCGGCFQNKLLLESCYDALTVLGYRVIFPQRLPPGDGGLALGQAWVASHMLSDTHHQIEL